MENEKTLTGQESLSIIRQMIETAKQEQKDDGQGWIVWGWILFSASVFTLLNIYLGWVSVYFFWNLFGAISLILLLFETIKYLFLKRKERVRTYTKDLFEKLNTGFFICLMLIVFSMNLGVSPSKGFALLLGLYGFWILIYGTVLSFRPSVIGAYITWGLAFASLFVSDFRWTMAFHAIAVLCGYIIPGHIAYKEFKKIRSSKEGV